MIDQPQVQKIEAVVFQQFSLKWQEVGKSAVVAGITSALAIIYLSINAGRFPTTAELLEAGRVGLLTAAGAIIRYFMNPTTTVIKGQADPVSNVIPPDTVVTKDVK